MCLAAAALWFPKSFIWLPGPVMVMMVMMAIVGVASTSSSPNRGVDGASSSVPSRRGVSERGPPGPSTAVVGLTPLTHP